MPKDGPLASCFCFSLGPRQLSSNLEESEMLDWVNSADAQELEDAFYRCCGCKQFAKLLAEKRPFSSPEALMEASRHTWFQQVQVTGWLEAFEAHPRIGDVSTLREKFASTATWCEGEQSTALGTADELVLQDLMAWNRKFEDKFGHIFIVCATGKSSREILEFIKVRFENTPVAELAAAAGEQQAITELRLKKMLEPVPAKAAEGPPSSHAPPPSGRRLTTLQGHLAPPSPSPTGAKPPASPPEPPPLSSRPAAPLWVAAAGAAAVGAAGGVAGGAGAGAGADGGGGGGPALRPPITTHVLDVSLGRPAMGVPVILEILERGASSGTGEQKWRSVGQSATDADGRSGPLMAPSNTVAAGTYKLTFDVATYRRVHTFYPEVSVVFDIRPDQAAEHFHVPVLLSPFSYSTYRGS